jgi:hypothetical protein
MLGNINSTELEYVISYLRNLDDPSVETSLPKELPGLMELYKVAEYLGLEFLKRNILKELATESSEFMSYTNARRHSLSSIDEQDIEIVRYFT